MVLHFTTAIAISGSFFFSDLEDRLVGTFYSNAHHNAYLTSFLSSFLYYNFSVFGEDALVNVSVEKKDDNDGKLAGYIRIRSKTQGIALSLGDRITNVQRGLPDAK